MNLLLSIIRLELSSFQLSAEHFVEYRESRASQHTGGGLALPSTLCSIRFEKTRLVVLVES
jgi:hypothetical protein